MVCFLFDDKSTLSEPLEGMEVWLRSAHTQRAESKVTPCDGPVSVVGRPKKIERASSPSCASGVHVFTNHLNSRISLRVLTQIDNCQLFFEMSLILLAAFDDQEQAFACKPDWAPWHFQCTF